MIISDYKKIVLTFFLLISANVATADVYVLHHHTLTEKIDQNTLQKILVSEQLQWSEGQDITLMINDINQISNENFTKVTKQSKSDFLQTWRAKYFSGRAFIPTQIKSTGMALERIVNDPSSIYVSIEQKIESNHKDIKLIKLSF